MAPTRMMNMPEAKTSSSRLVRATAQASVSPASMRLMFLLLTSELAVLEQPKSACELDVPTLLIGHCKSVVCSCTYSEVK